MCGFTSSQRCDDLTQSRIEAVVKINPTMFAERCFGLDQHLGR